MKTLLRKICLTLLFSCGFGIYFNGTECCFFNEVYALHEDDYPDFPEDENNCSCGTPNCPGHPETPDFCSVCGSFGCDGHNEECCWGCGNSVSNCTCGTTFCDGTDCECYGINCDPCDDGTGDPCDCFEIGCEEDDDYDDGFYDCADELNGGAYIDICGECVGGTTGKEPCNPCEGDVCPFCHGYIIEEGFSLRSKRLPACRLCDCKIRKNCDEMKRYVDNLIDFMNARHGAFSVNKDMDDLRDYALNSPNEWSRSFQFYPDDNIWDGERGGFVSGSPNQVVGTYTCATGVVAHTHPEGSDYTGPSALDLEAVLKQSDFINFDNACADINSDYLGIYIVAGDQGTTMEYFLYVDDINKALNFLTNNPGFVDPVSHLFMPGSVLDNLYQEAYQEFYTNRGYSYNSAHNNAFAYVLSQANTGITLFAKSSVGNQFHPYLVEKDNSMPKGLQFYIETCLKIH